MKNQTLDQLFMNELQDMYSAENQIIEALPKLIKMASLPDLKETLNKHLKETEEQIKRLEKIFSILEQAPKENHCEAMEGILREGNEIVKTYAKSPVLDAAIICAAQKVEHYEIATYGTLRSFAKHLDHDGDIIELLQDTLNEESAADRKLTALAEGGFFSSGINDQAAAMSS